MLKPTFQQAEERTHIRVLVGRPSRCAKATVDLRVYVRAEAWYCFNELSSRRLPGDRSQRWIMSAIADTRTGA